MTSLIGSALNAYYYVMDESADYRTNNWFLVRNPWPIIGILFLYHNFVYKFGPAFMVNRKPFNVDRLVQIYNIIQVLLCAWFVFECFVHFYGPTGAYGFKCQSLDRSSNPLALKVTVLAWGYFMMKLLDLMDTIFFVLRKKESQITFLHVYHHIGMVILTWCGVKYFPGGQGLYIVFINSLVHSLMYGYYFISNYKPEYRRHIWWKKYLTQIQIFLTIFIQYGRVLWEPGCNFPKWPIFVFLPHNFVILYLFAQFYKKSYKVPEKKSKIA